MAFWLASPQSWKAVCWESHGTKWWNFPKLEFEITLERGTKVDESST